MYNKCDSLNSEHEITLNELTCRKIDQFAYLLGYMSLVFFLLYPISFFLSFFLSSLCYSILKGLQSTDATSFATLQLK